MNYVKKIITNLIIFPTILLSLANAQTKTYINELKKDTTNGKVSINPSNTISKIRTFRTKLKKENNKGDEYFTKKELSKLNFVLKYDSLIIKDRLNGAEILVKKKLSNKELAPSITGELKLYKKYKRDIEQRLIESDKRFKNIVEKKKKFRKKLEEIVKEKDLKAYEEGKDFINHCINYCKRKNLPLPEEIKIYENKIEAKIFDKKSKYDLEKITKSKNNFEKILKPYIKSESLDKYLEAKNLLDTIEQYAKINPKIKLKHTEFLKERYLISRLIQKKEELLNYDEISRNDKKVNSYKFRNDTLNPEGIFTFDNKIIVIKSFNTKYKGEFLIKGEGTQKTDKMLMQYADKNYNSGKHLKANEKIKGGKVLPYIIDGNIKNYYFDQGVYQIRISYNKIRNNSFTKEIISSLKPIEIDTNYYGLLYEKSKEDGQHQFYRNMEGSFVKITNKDSIMIIADYDNKWDKDASKEKNIIDYVHIIKLKKHKKIESKKYSFNVENWISKKQFPIYKKYQEIYLENYNKAKKNFRKTQKK